MLPDLRRARVFADTRWKLSRGLERLRWLQRGERRLLVEAPVVLPAVALALRMRGLRWVQARLRLGEPTPGTGVGDVGLARRIAWCVYAGAAHGPWPANCLQRSVVTLWYLKRRQIEGQLRIGVRRGTDGRLDFHAWVEHDGHVINDEPDVRRRYATFDRAVEPAGARWDS